MEKCQKVWVKVLPNCYLANEVGANGGNIVVEENHNPHWLLIASA